MNTDGKLSASSRVFGVKSILTGYFYDHSVEDIVKPESQWTPKHGKLVVQTLCSRACMYPWDSCEAVKFYENCLRIKDDPALDIAVIKNHMRDQEVIEDRNAVEQ